MQCRQNLSCKIYMFPSFVQHCKLFSRKMAESNFASRLKRRMTCLPAVYNDGSSIRDRERSMTSYILRKLKHCFRGFRDAHIRPCQK